MEEDAQKVAGPNMSTQGPRNAIEVSAIVPVFNSERFIGKCVASLLASKYDPSSFEIICVDNGSSDGSLRVLRSFDPAIRVLEEAKRGPAAARNAGLREARGEFVAFTDSDCMVDAEWLAAMVRALRQGRADALGGRILARPEAGVVERFGELVHDHQNAIEMCHPPYMISMNLAMSRRLLLSLGGFDERWLRIEDVDLTYRLLAAEKRLSYCDDAVIYHHNRDRIWTLIREGYLHGYFAAAFIKDYAGFVRSYRDAHPALAEVRASPASELGVGVGQVQLYLLWQVFRNVKRVGDLAGRRLPPVLE
jgi:glycosyltransferase involved in cell wall biosynthesis